MAERPLRSRILLPAAIVLAGLGAAPETPPRPIRSDWHLRYEPLEDAGARSFLERALAFGRRRLGEPAIPVKEVLLRRSVPVEKGARIRRDFQLTEIADSEKGIFAIYLSARPGETAFEGQLAHEAFHLFDARIRDVYAEGLCTLLAEDFFREQGLSWEPWLRHFREGKEPLYGGAYFLAKDLAEAAGRESFWRILRFAVDSAQNPDRREIDIDRWLESLGAERAVRARAAIERRREALEALRKKDQPELSFRRPGAGGGAGSRGRR